MRRWGVSIVVVVLSVSGLALVPARAAGTVTESGYLPMADGVSLRYTLVRPVTDDPVAVLFEYSGYDPGTDPDPGYIRQFVEEDGRYAYLGVNLRGTGCSEGTFDFFQPAEAVDGARIVEWAAGQPWSNGRVGMIGKSYPGITQLFVAAERPEGLAAIAPGHPFVDLYRDVAEPGGIANVGFSSLWSFVGRPSYEFQSSPPEVLAGDIGCLRGSVAVPRDLATNPFVQQLENPFDNDLYAERSPRVEDIDVPVFTTMSWQDEQLGSRNTDLLRRLRSPWWAILTNGDHGMYRTPTALAELKAFFDHVLLDDDNGWEARAPLHVWWEAGRDGPEAPAWVSEHESWDEAARVAAGALEARPLFLGAGSLSGAGPGGGETAFVTVPVVGSEGVANPRYGYPDLPDVSLWPLAPPGGTAASFTTAPVSEPLVLLGSASADLWVSTVTPDLDVQVTLSEVRPDGQEMFIGQGWLRASHRALDAERSTALAPFHPHTAEVAESMPPGEPQLLRVEVFPFGHVLRSGSRLRLSVEQPTPFPQLWSFLPSPFAGPVTIHHDAAHPSALVVPVAHDVTVERDATPACGSLIRQPCR